MLYAIESLGSKQGRTREGFLVCSDVPVARTGELIYARGELPFAPGADGLVRVRVDGDGLFDPESMASLEGKDVVVGHPPGRADVKVANWRDLSVGHVQNVRRGTGPAANKLLADLVIKSAAAADAVRTKRLRQVSLGYMGRYRALCPGAAYRFAFHANHVALVPEGRAGVECSIGDAVPGPSPAQDWLQRVNQAMPRELERINETNRQFWANQPPPS